MKRCVVRANQALFLAAQLKTGLSLRQIALKVGVSHVTVNLWRSGKIGATMHNANELAGVLGVPVTDLWETRFLRPDGTPIPFPPSRQGSEPEALPAAPEVPPITFPGWDD